MKFKDDAQKRALHVAPVELHGLKIELQARHRVSLSAMPGRSACFWLCIQFLGLFTCMTCEPASGEAERRGLLPSARPGITVIISLIQGITRRLLSPACKMNFKNFRDYLAWLYYQYLLITGIYVLEPWEKSIFNSILFSAIAMVIYTSYVFVPIHVRLALEFFLQIFGGQPESAMALMN